jgi:hypothetical protein
MILTPFRLAPLVLFVFASGCTAPGTFPSLNPRPIEAKAADLLNEPAPKPIVLAPSDPVVARQIDAAMKMAQDSIAPFDAAAARAEKAVSAAGAAESESWVAAQMAVSDAEQARAGAKSALADLDSLLQRQISTGPSADLAPLQQAIRDVVALDARQTDRMATLLGGLNR